MILWYIIQYYILHYVLINYSTILYHFDYKKNILFYISRWKVRKRDNAKTLVTHITRVESRKK